MQPTVSPPPISSRLMAAQQAAKRIAPLWPLQHFVAVNPFLGMAGSGFEQACELYKSMVPGGMQMPLSYYADKIDRGAINEAHLKEAIARAKTSGLALSWPAEMSARELSRFAHSGSDFAESVRIHTVAEAVDVVLETEWERTFVDVISRFCAAFHDEGQASWKMPGREQGLYGAWKDYATADHLVEIWGLKGFRQKVALLPSSWQDALDASLEALEIPEHLLVDYLHKQLLSIRGWAGYVRFQSWHLELAGEEGDELLQLLAIRLAYEVALLETTQQSDLSLWAADYSGDSEAVLGHFLLQLADEIAWETELTAKLKKSETGTTKSTPQVQAVFCIDVRSEVFRRALESVSSKVETMGFAGFFGMPIESKGFGEAQGTAQCPVLLTPQYRVPEIPENIQELEVKRIEKHQSRHQRLTHGWNAFKNSAISSFSFVEVAGLKYLPKLFQDALCLKQGADTAHNCAPKLECSPGDIGISLEDQEKLALGALRNMGLDKEFARLVLLCGHGSQTRNNPYAAGLDCGACGGHSGAPNAKVAAAILNNPAVRVALKSQGIHIPESTWFLAGLHNTTTDDVEIFGTQSVPESHQEDMAELQAWLGEAGVRCREARSASLGLTVGDASAHRMISQRAKDWSQTRPEWGLAGNAAFIAAPRSRTKGLDLGGRAFLHNYDWKQDPANNVLELIMTAPMVVANWINLQYYASTVNNAIFGSGNKVTHNVCGTLGVCQGNGGDLQTGLPLQSVYDGKRWMHEPLRLHVLLEAPRERIDAVLAKHENVRQLVENGWLILFAIEEDGQRIVRRTANQEWLETGALA